MKNCVWLKPELVAQIEFAEWRWRTNYGILGLLGCGEGKAVISCNNPLKPDMSGLVIGTTFGAEEVARLAPRAKVVEVLFPFAELLHSGSVAFGAEKPTQFYYGDDASAKSAVAKLINDIGLEPVDAGPLTDTRYLEPLGMLMVQLAYVQGLGINIGTKLLKR